MSSWQVPDTLCTRHRPLLSRHIRLAAGLPLAGSKEQPPTARRGGSVSAGLLPISHVHGSRPVLSSQQPSTFALHHPAFLQRPLCGPDPMPFRWHSSNAENGGVTERRRRKHQGLLGTGPCFSPNTPPPWLPVPWPQGDTAPG